MSRAPRIDAHQHFWRIAAREGHWPPPALAAIHRDFGPHDLQPLCRAAGIDATVLVQTLPDEAETQEMLAIARQHPWVRGVVGWVDLKGADAPERIASLAADPRLRGLRPMLQDLPDDDWINDPALDPAVQAMQDHGLVFDALVLTRHLAALARFAERHPHLSIVVDHGAKPDIASGEIAPWRDGMQRLAALPHVCCKLSGLLTEAGDRRSREALQPYVQALWTLFGAERLVWGSDWPVLRLAGDYAGWLAMSHELLDRVEPAPTAAQRDAVFGLNALRLYSLVAHEPSSETP